MLSGLLHLCALLVSSCNAQYTVASAGLSSGSPAGAGSASGFSTTNGLMAGSTTVASAGGNLCTGNCSEANALAVVSDYAQAENQVAILLQSGTSVANDSATLYYYNQLSSIAAVHLHLNNLLMGETPPTGTNCLAHVTNITNSISIALNNTNDQLPCPVPVWGLYEYVLKHLGQGNVAFRDTRDQCQSCSNPGQWLTVIIQAEAGIDTSKTLVNNQDTSSNCTNAEVLTAQSFALIQTTVGGWAGNSSLTAQLAATTPITYSCPQPGQGTTINGQSASSYYG